MLAGDVEDGYRETVDKLGTNTYGKRRWRLYFLRECPKATSEDSTQSHDQDYFPHSVSASFLLPDQIIIPSTGNRMSQRR